MDSGEWIQVVDVLPGAEASKICCEKRKVSVCDANEYEALSYVWGNEADRFEVIISDESVLVTRNLHAALKQLRNTTQTRTLWIDQLCINQNNVKEKTHQVSMMRKIYKSCTRCVIWLGEVLKEHEISTADVQTAFDLIRKCAGLSEDAKLVGKNTDRPGNLQLIDPSEQTFRALQSMFRNSWWSRIWTVQEAVLPPEATLRWGDLELDWKILQSAAKNVRDNYLLHQALTKGGFLNINDYFLAPILGLKIAARGESPLNLLQRWRHRHASDQRDKVFGLNGLLSAPLLPKFSSCDYSLPVNSLFTQVTAELMQQEQGLRPLVGVRKQMTPDLPSWVIDFATCPKGSASDWWWDHSHRYRWFNADDGARYSGEVFPQSSTLSLRGIRTDRILEVGDPLYLDRAADADWNQIVATITSCKGIMDRYVRDRFTTLTHSEGQPCDTAFWLTLIGGLVTSEFPIRRAVDRDMLAVVEYVKNGTKSDVEYSLRRMIVNHAFFITEQGFLGIGPPNIQANDEIWILLGGRVPFALRPGARKGSPKEYGIASHAFTLVGNTFVHGMMDGEIFDLDRKVIPIQII